MNNKFLAIPTLLWKNKELSNTEIPVYIEILHLSTLEKGCIATNKHFATLLGKSTKTISRAITGLGEKGYISINTVNGSRNHIRQITPIESKIWYLQNVQPPQTKTGETKESKRTNIRDKKKINKKENSKSLFRILVKEIHKDASRRSKVTFTEKGYKAFMQISDRSKIKVNYLKHQEEKGQYAQTLANYLIDYEANLADDGDGKKIKKTNSPQVGSIAWELEQKKLCSDVIDVEIE